MSTEPKKNTMNFNIISMTALYHNALVFENEQYMTRSKRRFRYKYDPDLMDEDKPKQNNEESKDNEDFERVENTKNLLMV